VRTISIGGRRPAKEGERKKAWGKRGCKPVLSLDGMNRGGGKKTAKIPEHMKDKPVSTSAFWREG